MVDRAAQDDASDDGASDVSVTPAGPVLDPRRAATARIVIGSVVAGLVTWLAASVWLAGAPQAPVELVVATTASTSDPVATTSPVEPVLVYGRALPVIHATSEARPIVIGGWVSAGWPVSCPRSSGDHAQHPPGPPCAGILLPGTRAAPSWILYGGSDPSVRPFPPGGWLVSVVLGADADGANCGTVGLDCFSFADDQLLAWHGPLPFPGGALGAAPPGGLSRGEAIAEAYRAAGARPGGAVAATAALAGPLALVGPLDSWEAQSDRWVWSVVLEGVFPSPDCATAGSPASCPLEPEAELVVLDYLDGTFLIAVSPAP